MEEKGLQQELEKSSNALYECVESFVNNEELQFSDSKKQSNIEGMQKVISGIRDIVDGMQKMDPVVIDGLARATVNIALSFYESNAVGGHDER